MQDASFVLDRLIDLLDGIAGAHQPGMDGIELLMARFQPLLT